MSDDQIITVVLAVVLVGDVLAGLNRKRRSVKKALDVVVLAIVAAVVACCYLASRN